MPRAKPQRKKARPAPRGGGKATTIRDVAQAAGVSTATVSRALADPRSVAAATRSSVASAIAATGYTPNAAARSLRARSTKMVLTLLSGLGNSFFTPILDAIEAALSAAGYCMIAGDTHADPELEAHYDRLVRSGQVDGVLLLTGRLPRPGFAALDSSVPITIVCNDIPGVTGLPIVEIANREAAHAVTTHLINMGHRRIAHATGPADNIEARERLAGYRAALADANIRIDEGLVWEGAFNFEAGMRVGYRFLALSDRPTALFASSDEIAMGFIKTVKDAGLSVPSDVSVAGFDDIDYARFFDPALTTVHQPRAEIGHLAAEGLISRMAGQGTIPLRTRLPCTLVIRDSVRALRAPAAKTKRKARKLPA